MRREFDQSMDREAIRDQIGRILRSESFADKDQLKKLLEVLFNNMDAQAILKPDRVIKELWPEEAKTKRSADVATEMNRLRRALHTYYMTEGQTDPIRISLPNRTAPTPGGLKEKRWIVAEPLQAIKSAVIPVPRPPAPANPRRWLKIALVIGAVCTAAAIAILIMSEDHRPQFGRLDGPVLTILNAKGQELWHRSFPDGFWSDYYAQGLDQRLWIGDLDGDGHAEVLFLYGPADSPLSHSTTLICFSSGGKEKWHWTPGRDLPELDGTPPVYLTFGFGVLKAGPGERRRIVLSSQNQPFYPDQIAILDSNGKMVSEYWHSGILNHLALADLDGDGREEIVATGISNGYRQATLIVLDPDKVFGASEEAARPEVQLHGMGAAQERFRLLFPRSDLNRALEVYNVGQDMTIDQGRIRLIVSECTLNPHCDIVYEFDRSFHLRAVTPADLFVSAHKEFYLNRKDNHPFSKKEEDEFQKVKCLVGCKSEFVPVQIP
jgi:hypothetical protein